MSITSNKYLDKTYQYLLIGFGFFMPISIPLGNLFVYLIVLIWLVSGNYKNKLSHIKNNKVVNALVLFVMVYLIGLIWTDDINEGMKVIKKMAPYLIVVPILMSVVKEKYIKYYIASFLTAISITETLSYLIWFEIIPPFRSATVENPTPFMSHIAYNPILAFAIYLVLHTLLFEKLKTITKIIYALFAITMSINMFITGGRAGQVMYFAMLVIIIFQFFNKQILKSILVILITVPTIFTTAYLGSDLFQKRVNSAIYNIINFENNANTSVGLRMTYTKNSFELFTENSIFGVGTGDFPNEYEKIHNKNTPDLIIYHGNPHSMYALTGVQLGIIGLFAIFYLFYQQIMFAKNNNNILLKNAGITLPLLFSVIMISEIYLYLHYTKFLFIFFSAILYKKYDEIPSNR